MTAISQQDWMKDFGLDRRKPPHFFSELSQLNDVSGNISQSHSLRRAFDQLEIDGVLCQQGSPIIYFCQVKNISPDSITALHRSFWNQGVAPILVIIGPDEVHVYSGLVPPTKSPTESVNSAGLVEILKKVSDELRSFVVSVESGEYFHLHQSSFDPRKRVDRDLLRNLKATREKLGKVQVARLEPMVLDALLCRLVFTCYLFDRGVIDVDYLKAIDIDDANHLLDILSKKPRSEAKVALYKLFNQLGTDFNGDLFSSDLEAESKQVRVDHLEILEHFFHGTDVKSGQQSFWPYDFGFIPIETISAIYEHFLKIAGEEQKRETGAFYTPRFLAEFVLDLALDGKTSLLEKRFLDPACGSGIFLVGLFNRLANEWKLKNPKVRYDRRARELMGILRTNLYGIDVNPVACQITAFSLYLAFLDQLSPPDIKKLLGKWDRLPYLVDDTIRCEDFFTVESPKVDIIIGNPPWGSTKERNTPIENWCANRNLSIPARQMASAFISKAPFHLEDNGEVCFVLPQGILFNHNDTAIQFQKSFFRTYAVDQIVNLSDFRMFLFDNAKAGSLVIRYRKVPPESTAHNIDYWSPKTDWSTIQAEIISVLSQDRWRFTLRELLDDLNSEDAPRIWKKRFWATPRDWRLIDRLSIMPRLRDSIRRSGDLDAKERWIISTGLRPFGENDPESTRVSYTLPTRRFIPTRSKHLNLILLESDCELLPSKKIDLRRNLQAVDVFLAPHVLFTKGFEKAAYVDFDVAFLEAVRGIHGPDEDRDILMFLAAYLQSDLALFFLFHTSSNWGVNRPEVHVEEFLRLPFPFPSETHDSNRCHVIVREIATKVKQAQKISSNKLVNREDVILQTQLSVNDLIYEYFDIDDTERMLIDDTVRFIIPSVQPSRAKPNVPTIIHSSKSLRNSYVKLLCEKLNGWADNKYRVYGTALSNPNLGVGMVVLEKLPRKKTSSPLSHDSENILEVIDSIQKVMAKEHNSFELVRGLKVFHKGLLYLIKPLGQRFWTNTSALNDADEITGTILMRSVKEST